MLISLDQLALQLSAEIRGDRSLMIAGANSLDKATLGELTFISDEVHANTLKTCKAAAVLVGRSLSQSPRLAGIAQTLLIVEHAKQAFVKALGMFHPPRSRENFGISSQATVHSSVKVGLHTNIYPGAHIGADVIIGERCDIHPGVCIGPGCRIGDGCTLYPHAVLYHDVHLGQRVIVHAGAVIGCDGFGYHLIDGKHQKLPHYGRVRIDDDVEIGANTTIDRALVGETSIGRGSKIDNLVMIAHNCELGQHNVLASQVGFAGSVTTGDYVVCAGQVGIADHVHLGTGTILAAQTGVPKSLPGGQTYFGSPAIPIEEARKQIMILRKIGKMREDIRQAVSDIKILQVKLDQLMRPKQRPGEESASAA